MKFKARLCFYTFLSVILFTGGGGVNSLGRHPPCADPPPRADTPMGRHPLGRHHLDRHPLGRHPPRQNPPGQTSPEQTNPAQTHVIILPKPLPEPCLNQSTYHKSDKDSPPPCSQILWAPQINEKV